MSLGFLGPPPTENRAPSASETVAGLLAAAARVVGRTLPPVEDFVVPPPSDSPKIAELFVVEEKA
jgi:hypothetical protein